MAMMAQTAGVVKPPPLPTVEDMALEYEAALRAWLRVIREFQRAEMDMHDETPACVLSKLQVLAGPTNGFDPMRADDQLANIAGSLDRIATAAGHAESMGPAGRAAWTLARERVYGGTR